MNDGFKKVLAHLLSFFLGLAGGFCGHQLTKAQDPAATTGAAIGAMAGSAVDAAATAK